MRRAFLLGAILALAACSTAAPPPQAAPPPPMATPAPARPAPQLAEDSCGARAVQHLVGRLRSEIPVPVNPDLQRVACATCPVTMDFNPSRLNFFFDAETGRIKEARCG